MNTIGIELIHKDAVIPTHGSRDAACVDLVATEIVWFKGSRYATVRFGIKMALPKGTSFEIKPRSSFTHKGWFLANTPGEIDSDYRGEIMAKFEAVPIDVRIDPENNLPYLVYEEFPYKVGERCVQGKLCTVMPIEFVKQELTVTERGAGGFGSTGKNVKITKTEET